MKIAYIAAPYRGNNIYQVGENINIAKSLAVHLWRAGWAVVCPHTNSAFFDGSCSDTAFLEGYIEIMKRCDVVFTPADGSHHSQGTQKELNIAKVERMPIIWMHYVGDGTWSAVSKDLEKPEFYRDLPRSVRISNTHDLSRKEGVTAENLESPKKE